MPAEKMYAVKLLKNTNIPVASKHEVIEAIPAKFPGVGFPGKIWKGSIVKLPLSKAKELVDSGLAERTDVFAED